MQIEVWGQTDVGLKREINQDTILVDKKLQLYIVADGMGGHKGGEVASAMAVETVREVVENKLNGQEKIAPRQLLQLAYAEASARIHHKSTVDRPELMGMGTTMVGALCIGDRMFIANVGDSRAYLYSQNHLWQLTEDHSLVNEQVKQGVISEEDAAFVAGRNVITRSVGFEREVLVDVIERDMQGGEYLLICSDGLSGLVPDERIAKIIKEKPEHQVVPICIKEAKDAGGDDNVSVLLLKMIN